jgi:hypothetical protein
MTDKKLLSPAILAHIAQTLNIPLRGLCAVIELMDDEGTVPFIGLTHLTRRPRRSTRSTTLT